MRRWGAPTLLFLINLLNFVDRAIPAPLLEHPRQAAGMLAMASRTALVDAEKVKQSVAQLYNRGRHW
jgi:hypothetical protein